MKLQAGHPVYGEKAFGDTYRAAIYTLRLHEEYRRRLGGKDKLRGISDCSSKMEDMTDLHRNMRMQSPSETIITRIHKKYLAKFEKRADSQNLAA